MFESGAITHTREEIREMSGYPPEKPEPGMGTLPPLDMSMFTPEENIQTARTRSRQPNQDPDETSGNADDDNEDASNSGQNPQTQR